MSFDFLIFNFDLSRQSKRRGKFFLNLKLKTQNLKLAAKQFTSVAKA